MCQLKFKGHTIEQYHNGILQLKMIASTQEMLRCKHTYRNAKGQINTIEQLENSCK